MKIEEKKIKNWLDQVEFVSLRLYFFKIQLWEIDMHEIMKLVSIDVVNIFILLHKKMRAK